jgi:hypothetical protein
MSKTILEQALAHLLNKEEEQASALLHDYYVGIGRKVYEDIMADDVAFEDEDTTDVDGAIEEVDADLTEEGDEEAAADLGDEMGMGDEEAAADMGDEMGDDMGAEPVEADAADVADAMMDVESALAKLKAEFEEMVSGEGDADADMGAEEEFGAEEETEEMPESIEESAELTAVSKPDNSDKADEKHSPVAGKNPVGARPATAFGGSTSGEGVASGTTPAKAPKAQDQGGTTKPAVSKVAKPGSTPGREAGSSSDVLPKGRG